MKNASEYKADEIKEAAPRMRLETVERLLEEEKADKDRSTVVEALEARKAELEDAGNANGGSTETTDPNGSQETVSDSDSDLPAGSEVTIRRNAAGPTASQKEGFTPTPEAVAKAKSEGAVPPQGLEFAPDDQRARVAQVDPHGPGAQRAEAIAAQVDSTIAQGEGPYLGSGVGKVSPPAPAHAPGEPDPSGSHAAGMTARSLGAAPPAPTRFDGRDTGLAPRNEVGYVEETKKGGGEPGIAEAGVGEPTTTEDLVSAVDENGGGAGGDE